MPYTSQLIVEQAFGNAVHVLELLGSAVWDAPTLAKFAEKLAQADSEVDGLIAQSNRLPLTPPYPPLVITIATKIVCYMLYRDADFSNETNPRLQDYKDARADLKAIAAGTLYIAPLTPDNVTTGRAYVEGDEDSNYDAAFDPSQTKVF